MGAMNKSAALTIHFAPYLGHGALVTLLVVGALLFVLSSILYRRGLLWRVAEAHAMQFYDHQVPLYAMETLYDLQSGRYLALGLTNEEKRFYNFGYQASNADYLPAALRNMGVR